ncbi:HAD-superfamily subfamily IIA hydrolase [Apiospora kogelbergensis]|uniref:HAD-superfamily subfamily IIA hydrolase n=1 Tax=Apiospora kogelbergensis TaxID=1337665 RepID=A0AAW0QP60_9PEZI
MSVSLLRSSVSAGLRPRSLANSIVPSCKGAGTTQAAHNLGGSGISQFTRARLSLLGKYGNASRSYSIDYKKKDLVQAPPFAFAFDIDGVLLHVAKPIPGATETLRYLQKHQIPFILLTNGGGKHEKDRVADLSSKLNVELSTENFVQSHTPFQELVHGPDGLKDKNILITGSDAAKSRKIAETYGFKNVITPADILMAHPTIWPFEPLMKELYAATARPLPSPKPKIDAMFVFNDPRDWALDIQIISDLLLSQNGVLGTYSSRNGKADLPNGGWQTDGQPTLYFSNADLFWAAQYHHPRLGQGAFQAAIAGIWKQITGGTELQRTVIGKPYKETYEYAERVLSKHRAQMLGTEARKLEPLRSVYMIGDNPESDIRGANEFESPVGTSWSSVLVRTGVYTDDRGEPAHPPSMVVDDVAAAVEWALRQEGYR